MHQLHLDLVKTDLKKINPESSYVILTKENFLEEMGIGLGLSPMEQEEKHTDTQGVVG